MRKRLSKLVHFASTVWFVACIGYVLITAMLQAGVKWWVIFSLSGPSALAGFLLISLYLFAIYKGVSRTNKTQIEHPLTTTTAYCVFYDLSPFLGGVAGFMAVLGISSPGQMWASVAMGTLLATFLVWIVVDPLTAFIESTLPESRKHHRQRVEQTRAERLARKRQRQELLADILKQEEQQLQKQQGILLPQAKTLAELLEPEKNITEGLRAEQIAVDIGANAWKTGGLGCMRQLHSMTMKIYTDKHPDSVVFDYISTWWDGIGAWRTAPIR